MVGLIVSALRVLSRLPGAMALVFVAAALTQLLAVLPIVAIALVGAEAHLLSTLSARSGAGRNPRAASAVLIRLVILLPLSVPLVGMWLLLLPAALADALGIPASLGLVAFVLLAQFAGAAAALWRLGLARPGTRAGPAILAAIAAALPWAVHFLWAAEAMASIGSAAVAFGFSEALALAVIGAAAFGEPQAARPAPAPWVSAVLTHLGEAFRLALRAPLALVVVVPATPADPFAFYFFSWSISPAENRSWAESLPEDVISAMTLASGLAIIAALAHLLARIGGRNWPRPALKALAIIFGALTLRGVAWFLMTVMALVTAFAAGWNAPDSGIVDLVLYPFLLAVGAAGGNLVALAIFLVARPALARAVEGATPAEAPAAAALTLALLGAARVAALFLAFGLGETSSLGLFAGLALFGLIELVTLAALACAALRPAAAGSRLSG